MGDFGSTRDKWVCPNDRELSLRAKLKTGWSVKTGTINSFVKPEQPTEKEKEAILRVIRRAEDIEKVEQERVGRLVERLDNMKKNAMGNGLSQCILCADEFGILGASPLHCNDCRRAVCTKCSVDTVSAHKEPLWLCKICAETRETWKKSGAWFYRGLPQYILPAKKTDHVSNKYGGSATSLNKGAIQPPTEHHAVGGSPRTCNAWILHNKSRNSSDSSKDFTDSSDEDSRTTKLTRRHTTAVGRRSSVDSNDSVNFAGSDHLSPKVTVSPAHYDATNSSYPTTSNNSEAVSEANPGPHVRGQDQASYRSSPKSTMEEAGASNTYRGKQKKDAEAIDSSRQDKPFRGHVRHESISSSGSYISPRVKMFQEPLAQQPPQQAQTAHHGRPPTVKESYNEAVSPEGSSKTHIKRLFRKLKRK